LKFEERHRSGGELALAPAAGEEAKAIFLAGGATDVVLVTRRRRLG
jgi:hypothetical protein